MARTEPPALFAPGANSGSLVPVSSSCSLSSSPPSSSTTAASPPPSLCRTNQVVITCYHASVAQKSYGGEKRFLCPPPAVLMHGDGYSARGGDARPSSSAHAPLECQTSFNERNVALFKSLHVTGMQKAKSFRLRLDLLTPSGASGQMYGHDHRPWQAPEVYASLESDPVAIISKPSKKTAKARNQSSCIRAGSLISLFNRINSQTFRTKYLNVDHNTNRWVAQSHNWSPLEVVVVSASGGAAHGQQPGQKQHSANGGPLYYGSEIVLVESRRNFRSPPMIIHKVERGRLVENACSPVSQMQKVALQL
ncbi:p53-like transcription factor, partial [Martensiomyces pterosporus]